MGREQMTEGARQERAGGIGQAAERGARRVHAEERRDDPDDGERDERGSHREDEEVENRADPRPRSDDREAEALPEELAEALDERDLDDEEAPEREGVRKAGARPLKELLL